MENKVSYKSEIALFLFLFLTGSYTVTNDIISSFLTIGLWVALALYLLASMKEINNSLLGIMMVSVFIIIISDIHNRENIVNTFSFVFSVFTVFLYASIYSFNEFKESYIKVMKILCIISLVGMIIFAVFPFLGNYFVSYGVTGKRYSNLFIYTNMHDITRNMGMFWEPGAFQTYILLAILLEISEKKPNIKTLIVFIATVITTFSTTGYIGIVLIFLLAMVKHKEMDGRFKGFIVIAVIAILAVLYFFSEQIFSTESSTVFGKIINFFDRKDYDSNRLTSVSVRYYSLLKPFEEFLKNPILGCGYEGLMERTARFTYGMNTCTFINWYAIYGGIYGIIMTIGFVKFSKCINDKGLALMLTFIILFIATMSENYIHHATMMLFAFIGYQNRFNVLREEHENAIQNE